MFAYLFSRLGQSIVTPSEQSGGLFQASLLHVGYNRTQPKLGS